MQAQNKERSKWGSEMEATIKYFQAQAQTFQLFSKLPFVEVNEFQLNKVFKLRPARLQLKEA